MTTFCHADHIPVGHHVKGLIQRSLSLHRPIIWDEAALIDPARISAFQTALATLPIPTWDVTTEAHKDWYEYQLLQLGAQFFEKRKGTRNRPILSADTLQIIAMKRHLLDCARAWGIVQEQDFKEQLKPVEHAVRRAVRIDLGIFYDQLLVQLQQADGLGDQKRFFDCSPDSEEKEKDPKGPPDLCPCSISQMVCLPTLSKKDSKCGWTSSPPSRQDNRLPDSISGS